jgi:hypothetical protein
MRVIREIISQAQVLKCWTLRHILSISAHTFASKVALNLAMQFERSEHSKRHCAYPIPEEVIFKTSAYEDDKRQLVMQQ